MVDVNVYQEGSFHARMRLKQLGLDTGLFGEGVSELPPRDAERIRQRIDHEIMEIFYGRNIQRRTIPASPSITFWKKPPGGDTRRAAQRTGAA